MSRIVADCRDFPSQTNCTLTISGEEDEVLTAATHSMPYQSTDTRTPARSAPGCARISRTSYRPAPDRGPALDPLERLAHCEVPGLPDVAGGPAAPIAQFGLKQSST